MIICGDCRQIMKSMDNNSIDMIITSPPYNIGVDYDVYDDSKSWQDYLSFIQEVINLCYDVIVEDGRIAINIPHVLSSKNNKHFPLCDYINILIQAGFNIREVISWFKATDTDHFSGGSTAWGSYLSASNPHLRGLVESIIVANKNTWKKEGDKSDITKREWLECTKSAWFIKAESDRTHPAPFPVEIPYKLIKLYTFINDIILDPFAGSCTTAVACKQTNRQSVMIELSYIYCQMGKRRLQQEYLF